MRSIIFSRLSSFLVINLCFVQNYIAAVLGPIFLRRQKTAVGELTEGDEQYAHLILIILCLVSLISYADERVELASSPALTKQKKPLKSSSRSVGRIP